MYTNSTVVPIHLAFKYPVRGYPRLEDKTVWRCCDQIWTPDAITCKIVDTEELLDGVQVKVIDEKRISELPTHAKAMGWASGFNGRAT